jgi:site-specific DNA-methyltransferase (adenine-specific)
MKAILGFHCFMPVKRKTTIPQFELEVRERNGTTYPLDLVEDVQIHYENRLGRLHLGDSLAWLKGLKSESVDLVFADPPYNIKKADWDDFESHEHYVAWSHDWLSTRPDYQIGCSGQNHRISEN